MKGKKLLQNILLVMSATMLILVPVISLANSQKSDKKLASVNGTVLTERQIDEYMQRVFPAGMFHSLQDPEKNKKYRKEAIELMIDDELLYQKAKKMGFKAKKKEVDKAEEKVIERFESKEMYPIALKKEGLSQEAFRKQIEKKIVIKKFLKKEVDEKAELTDADAKAYYEERKNTYKRPEARRLSHILIKVEPSASPETWAERKKKAEEARQKIVDGADFRDVAWDYSDDDYRVKGGDLGLMHKGRLVPELEDKVWELKEGELSEVIQTIYGYHIVRVEEIKQPEQLKFEDVKDKIKRDYFEKKSKELKEALLSKAREKAKIERYEE